ncbi:4-oxalomesaconate tautomerase [Actinobacillus equuli subsp. haemolyticus]|uniref:4-oxalomesaconate tautomerase n=1 Tax=Actinobacillus equuli TaxID=718 RepID=UPI002440FDAB|nr:4-oxalomesaconate tautomerase [Actinobacillus equuli]WGE63974.1 4-oxalomesaconate tautomerase [Actinobacillus equuli subsp. haemolyticus]
MKKVPCMIIRGGTSKGVYFLKEDLPADVAERDKFLMAIMGSGDPTQINGLGGATSVTSKVAIVSKSEKEGVDLDYLFAQVGIGQKVVDTAPSCGNILSGIICFASEKGLIELQDGITSVVVNNVNTNSIIEVSAESPNKQLKYTGNAEVSGVPGTGSPVNLNFSQIEGAKTGKVFPTGNKQDNINGYNVTCIDVAMPMVLFNAQDLGLTGKETKAELDENRALFEIIEPIRRKAGEMMGLGDVSEKVIPKMGILSAPAGKGNITSRYFVPDKCHASHAVTGSICVSAACNIEGTVANPLYKDTGSVVTIEHPSGFISVDMVCENVDGDYKFTRAALVRTAKPLMMGEVYYDETAE